MAVCLATNDQPEPRGDKLYLLHGGPGAQGSLHGLCNALAQNLHPREILQRRHDSSAADDEESPVLLTVEQHLIDMAEIVREPSNILGHSWGAMLALSFASRFPSLCKQLILVGCGTYSPISRAEYELRMATLIDPAVKSQLKQKIANAPDRHIRLAAFKAYGDYVASVQAYDPLPDPSPDPFPVYDPEGHAETWLDAMRLQEQGVEPTRFSSITCPATMIHGADDPHPANLIFADLKPHIPQLQLIELDKCGHEPWLERHTREEFLRLVQHLCQS